MNASSPNAKEFLERLTELTKANLTNSQFGVSELAREMGMSRSNLHLKVKKLTKTSASQFINQVRLKKAMEILKQGSVTISETAFDCGFQSVSYFTKCFHTYYGYPPSETQKHSETKEIELIHQNKVINYEKWSMIVIVLMAIIFPVILASYNLVIKKILPSRPSELENTIAVLPFKNDSFDSTNTYFINGLMGDIINNLSNNPNLIVRSRTSTENYGISTQKLPEIARELNVNYIVEGSGQTYDSIVIMNIQLMNARTDENIKSWRFPKVVNEVADINDLQKEIVTNIVAQLNAGVNSGEKNWYKNIPSKNLQALKYYWEGMELNKFSYNDVKLAQQAREKFELALKLDSGFVLPMVQLGWFCIGRAQRNFNVRPIYFDSAFYYAHRAIKFDNESSDAYHLLGRLNHVTGNTEEALENYKMALQYDENESVLNLALLFFETGKYVKAIDLLYKQLIKEKEYGFNANYWILINLKQRLELLGFYDESRKYTNIILKQNNDSTAWLNNIMYANFVFGNFDSVRIFADRWFKVDTLKLNWYENLTWTAPWALLFSRNYEQSNSWFQKYMSKQISEENISYNRDGLAFLYLISGQKEKADSAFAASIKKLNHQIEIYHWHEMAMPHVLLASVYSSMGENEKAIETLRKNKSTHLLAITQLKYNPMFDNIRSEAEFQEILASIETKFQKIHNKAAAIVRKYEIQN